MKCLPACSKLSKRNFELNSKRESSKCLSSCVCSSVYVPGPAGIVRYSPYLSVHLSAVCFFSIIVFIWHSCYKIPFDIALRSVKEAYKPPDNSENSFSAVTASLNSSKHKRTSDHTHSLASNAAQTAWQVDAMSLICMRHAQGVGVYLGAPPPSARAAVIIFNSLYCQAVHW
ncbi:hypothetical protein DPX16_12393 [Anabarilius grahami]|uniref:Uncharacterized protein n=1 Tax=Anabarilius grahami TaxID=495550 RepID=A0A3N0XGR9_ANAGA|nr:hypothetical protein DPX16_12393 [Anabarilius grahami]